MSIVERYEGQVEEKGWGRIVSKKTFYKAYDEEMLNTINSFEKKGMVSLVEVYMRGKLPAEPVRIYNSDNREYNDAKIAVIIGRERDKEMAVRYFEETFNKQTHNNSEIIEIKELLERISELYNCKKIEN